MTRIAAAYRNQRGFTLIELLVVIAIIAVLRETMRGQGISVGHWYLPFHLQVTVP